MRRRDAITLMTTVDRASLRSRAPRWWWCCCCCRCCCSTAHKRPSPTRLKIARKSVRGSMYSATIGTSGYWHPVIWMFSSFWEDVIPIAPFHYFLLDVFRLTHTHTHTHLFRSVKIKCSTRYEFMQMSAWCNWGKYRAAFKGVAKINCPLYTISQKTSYLYLAITLTCMNWFLSFLGADLLQIKLAIKTCFIASMLYLTKHINAKSHEFAWCARVHLVAA